MGNWNYRRRHGWRKQKVTMANCGIMVGVVIEKEQINYIDCFLSIDGCSKKKSCGLELGILELDKRQSNK